MKTRYKLLCMKILSITFTILPYRTIEHYTLKPAITNKFISLCNEFKQNPYTEWDFYKTTAKNALMTCLPKEVLHAIEHMRDHGSPLAIVIHTMPIDSFIPPTPIEKAKFPCKTKGYVSELSLLGICSILNCSPVAALNLDKKSYDYIHQIIPLDDEQSKQSTSSAGSLVAFEPHTEAVHLDPSIKFFELLALRGNKNVATSLFLVDDLFAYIKQHVPKDKSYTWILEQLKKPQFKMLDSANEHQATTNVILPILAQRNGEQIFRFNANGQRIQGINKEAQYVVDYLKKILLNREFQQKYGRKFYLQTGDMLIFNNWSVLHARDAFIPDPTNRRWLQRCYCMSN